VQTVAEFNQSDAVYHAYMPIGW